MKTIGKVLMVAAIAITAIACQNAGDASQSTAVPSDSTGSTVQVEKLAPSDTISAEGYKPTGDMTRDAVTFVQVLYDKNIPVEMKERVHGSFTAYYTREGKGDEFMKAVDVESRKLTGENEIATDSNKK